MSKEITNYKLQIMILRTLCVAIVLGAIITIFWTYAQADRYAQPGVLTVLPITSDPMLAFSYDQVWDLSTEFDGRINTEQLSTREITHGARSAFAQVSFMTAYAPNNNIIVLSESTAWTLFGSLNVVGLSVMVGDNIFTISDVTRDIIEPHGHVDGFAWIPFYTDNQNAAILHFVPKTYNRLQARLDIEQAMATINRRTVDYVIIDISQYINSIALRGQILLSMAGIVFIFTMLRLAHQIARGNHEYIQNNQRWIWVAGISMGCMAALLLLFPFMYIDLWLPAFAPEGWRGYAQLLFNSGLSVPRQYLPSNLVMLQGLNERANWALGVGVITLVVANLQGRGRGTNT